MKALHFAKALPLVIAAVSIVPVTAEAKTAYSAVGSGVCHATTDSSGLQFAQFALRNKGTSTRYVTCHIPFIRERVVELVPGAGYELALGIGSLSTTPQTVTCTASVGGGGSVARQSTKSVSVTSSNPGVLEFSHDELRAGSDADSLAILCALPAGTQLGLVYAHQPEFTLPLL